MSFVTGGSPQWKHFFLATTMALVVAGGATAQQYTVAERGSKIEFTVTRGKDDKLRGWLNNLKGTIVFNPEQPEKASFDVTVNSSTAKTGDAVADYKVKTEAFLNPLKFPEIRIKSTSVKKDGGPVYVLNGELTLKGITKPVKIQFTALPSAGGYTFRGLLQLSRKLYNIGEKGDIDDNITVYLQVAAKRK
ncbi:MAG: YceI family protein [Taibaiella sp.]|nr:YceI family protein [Taibaiella sp.]